MSVVDDRQPITRHRSFHSRYAWPLLAVGFVLCGVVSGPVQSWPTFEPILGAHGVLGSDVNHTSTQLDDVYSLGTAAGMLLSIPMGVLYDACGGRVVFLTGGLAASLGLCGTALAISHRALNWMLFISYPLAVSGGYLTAYGLFDWMLLLPKHQMLVGSLIGASMAASDSLALVGIALHDYCGVHIVYFFW